MIVQVNQLFFIKIFLWFLCAFVAMLKSKDSLSHWCQNISTGKIVCIWLQIQSQVLRERGWISQAEVQEMEPELIS